MKDTPGIDANSIPIEQEQKEPQHDWLKLVEDGADIQHMELPPVVEIVAGLIAERTKVVIGSGAKSFKTWFTMDGALSIAHGFEFLGRITTRQRVLYVNLELKPQTFQRRVQMIAEAKGIEIDRQWFLHLPLRGKLAGLPVHQVINNIIHVAGHFGATVIIVDPLYKLNTEGEENNAADQTRLFNELDRITTEGKSTLILNDHFGKGNQSEKDALDTLRGSSAKGGDVDAALILRKHETDECFTVDVIHRELPPVPQFVIGWEFPLMRLRDDLDPADMKKAKGGRRKEHDPKRFLKAIRKHDRNNPISISAWAEAAKVHRSTLAGYLTDMRQNGWIETIGDGSNSRQAITPAGLAAIE